MNLIEIGQVVIEIRGVENGELTIPVNNTLIHHTAFLANDTRPCVLILRIIDAQNQPLFIHLHTSLSCNY